MRTLDLNSVIVLQEVDRQVPDEKRKGKMRTVQEMEYLYEPEMEGTLLMPCFATRGVGIRRQASLCIASRCF